MHASRSALLGCALALSLPAAADAQIPLPTPTPTATPAPAPAAAGTLSVAAKAPHRSRGRQIALKGDVVDVSGSLQPAVAGQEVLVQLRRGRRTLGTERARTAADGSFTARVRLRGTGALVLRGVHRASPEIRRTTTRAVRIQTFAPRLRFGARGALVRLFQRALDRMKYPVPRNGVYDAATGRAVMAYRKVNSMARRETADARVIRGALSGRGAYRVRHPRAGRHVEVDLSRQVLALVNGDKLVRVYPTSSGAPATPTVLGSYRFYRKEPGINALEMVHSSYFIRGYAIHGYKSVPPYGASHGCLRVPIPNALSIFNWIRIGDRIIVER